MVFALLGVAVLASSYAFLNKIAINKGLSSKEYLLSTSIGIALLSPLMFLFLPYKMIWNIISILLLIGASAAIILKVLFTSKALEKVSPLEASSFATLAVILTFGLDILLGINGFNLYALFALIVVLAGCIVISKGGKRIKEIKLELILLLIGQLGQGYATYYATKSLMSPATFLFFVFAIIAVVLLIFYKKFGPISKKSLAFGIGVQVLGLVNAILEVMLVQGNITYFMLRIPAIMVATIALTFILKKYIKERTDKVQLIGSVIVFVGLVFYALTQILF